MYIHHVGKPTDQAKDVDSETRGSSSLAGYYDIHFAIRCRLHDKNHLYVTLRSNEFEERYYISTWHISKEAGTAYLEMREVPDLDGVVAQESDGYLFKLNTGSVYSPKLLQRAWELKGSEFEKVLDKLAEEGKLVKVTNGWKRGDA